MKERYQTLMKKNTVPNLRSSVLLIIYQIVLYLLQSPKKFRSLNFSIFLLEILNMGSLLNLAVNYVLRFLAQLKRSFQENIAKISPKSKFKNRSRELTAKFS